MQKTKKISLILGVLVMSFAVGYLAFAWTDAPTGTAPYCPTGYSGCDAPIHVGSAGQTKTGALTLIGDLTAYRLVDYTDNTYYIDPANTGYAGLFAGKVGIGTKTPGAKLEVAGSVSITGTSSYLNLPSLTTVQRDALTPVTGMMVYNTTLSEAQVYIPGGWTRMGRQAALGTVCSTALDCLTENCSPDIPDGWSGRCFWQVGDQACPADFTNKHTRVVCTAYSCTGTGGGCTGYIGWGGRGCGHLDPQAKVKSCTGQGCWSTCTSVSWGGSETGEVYNQAVTNIGACTSSTTYTYCCQ